MGVQSLGSTWGLEAASRDLAGQQARRWGRLLILEDEAQREQLKRCDLYNVAVSGWRLNKAGTAFRGFGPDGGILPCSVPLRETELHPERAFVSVSVPGLPEKRPLLVFGDLIFFRPSRSDSHCRLAGQEFHGRVVSTQGTTVVVHMPAWFKTYAPDAGLSWPLCSVRFHADVIQTNRCLRAMASLTGPTVEDMKEACTPAGDGPESAGPNAKKVFPPFRVQADEPNAGQNGSSPSSSSSPDRVGGLEGASDARAAARQVKREKKRTQSGRGRGKKKALQEENKENRGDGGGAKPKPRLGRHPRHPGGWADTRLNDEQKEAVGAFVNGECVMVLGPPGE